ncbi:hypothetical protein A2U01_0114412, partial [Trifolium medium]|nr:hypothetical protein [Trifolium medium]
MEDGDQLDGPQCKARSMQLVYLYSNLHA